MKINQWLKLLLELEMAVEMKKDIRIYLYFMSFVLFLYIVYKKHPQLIGMLNPHGIFCPKL